MAFSKLTFPLLFTLIIIAPLIFVLSPNIISAEGGGFRISQEVSMRLGDVFYMAITPPASDLAAYCSPYSRQRFQLYMAANVSFQSIVEVLPEEGGYYNVTITFLSPNPWRYGLGVLTGDPSWYERTATKVTRLQSGYYVEFQSGTEAPPGNYTITITLSVRRVNPSGSLIELQFPTSMGLFLLALVASPLAYFNAFLIVDSYYRSKSEEVSRRRWIGVAVALILSALLLFILYGTLTPMKGG
ncbi:MAG: hypothetical protein QW220_04910 [Candidatus Bathyarchaeia archaeon]